MIMDERILFLSMYYDCHAERSEASPLIFGDAGVEKIFP